MHNVIFAVMYMIRVVVVVVVVESMVEVRVGKQPVASFTILSHRIWKQGGQFLSLLDCIPSFTPGICLLTRAG